MARFATAALALTTVVSTGTSLYLWNALQAERAISQSELERVSASSADLAREREPTGLAARAPAVLPTPPASESSPQASSSAPVVSTSAAAAPLAAEEALRRQRQQWSDPKARATLVRQRVSNMRRIMPDLGDALGFDEAGVERFLTTVAEGSIRDMERRVDSGNLGTAEARSGDARSAREVLEDVIAMEYGSYVLGKWREYEASLPARFAVRGVQMSLADADVALSKDQRQRMIAAYNRALIELRPDLTVGAARAAVSTGTASGARSSPTPEQLIELRRQQLDVVQLINARIEQEARSILTAEQQAALERHLRTELEMQREAIENMNSARVQTAPAP